MKGTLLVLALLVTQELGIEMGESRKEGQMAFLILASLCLTPSPPPHGDLQVASRDRVRGQLGDRCPGVLHKPPEVFRHGLEGEVWRWRGP